MVVLLQAHCLPTLVVALECVLVVSFSKFSSYISEYVFPLRQEFTEVVGNSCALSHHPGQFSSGRIMQNSDCRFFDFRFLFVENYILLVWNNNFRVALLLRKSTQVVDADGSLNLTAQKCFWTVWCVLLTMYFWWTLQDVNVKAANFEKCFILGVDFWRGSAYRPQYASAVRVRSSL